MLFASIADGPRSDAEARKTADAALENMTVEDTLAGGLASDFSEQCLAFLRAFDVDDHGPALVAMQKAEFISTLRTLFTDGYIYCEPSSAGAAGPVAPATAVGPTASVGSSTGAAGSAAPPADTAASAAGSAASALAPKTMTQIAMEQLSVARVFHYRDRTMVLWGIASASVANEVLKSMQAVVDTVIARLDADLCHADLLSSFEVFNIKAWQGRNRANWGAPESPRGPPGAGAGWLCRGDVASVEGCTRRRDD